ncbi:hypothetical protein I2485_06760 [Nesterenkonia sp. E16_7]|uniref:hypothetical protein n=1 Tax=unclassified Nesterenkonia TaxID=2629769 RepID=UPI001A92B63D|nr:MULTISPECIES: hypothetical protein [unclassified Nesterenkonia]MBO0596575.1 hypothetical protein [Nesterenkonia sp. E16_10]MBO0598352.1 hypothetical protein [Nesterenkonia sp. E16_7]
MAPAFHASLEHFNLGTNPGSPSRRDVVLPAEPGLSHACHVGGFYEQTLHQALDKHRAPQFLEEPGEYRRAACGKKVKALLPIEFSDQDPDACPACVAAVDADKSRAQHSKNDWPPACG